MLNGSVYFLLSNMCMKKDVVLVYLNVDSFINTAAECNVGIEYRDKMVLKMIVFCSEYVLFWYKGKSIFLKNVVGLKVVFLSVMKSVKCNFWLFAMFWRTRGRSIKLKKCWVIVIFRFDVNRCVVVYIVCGFYLLGLVKYKIFF